MSDNTYSNGDGGERTGGPAGPASTDVGTSLSPSVAFTLLADERDRFALYVLAAQEVSVPVDDLVTRVTALENETKPASVTQKMERRTRTRLCHSTLPKLTSYRIATRDADAVELTDRGEQLQPYLEFSKDRERRYVQALLEQHDE